MVFYVSAEAGQLPATLLMVNNFESSTVRSVGVTSHHHHRAVGREATKTASIT